MKRKLNVSAKRRRGPVELLSLPEVGREKGKPRRESSSATIEKLLRVVHLANFFLAGLYVTLPPK
jgi:hypothetical protein